jgi:hypothetical protein
MTKDAGRRTDNMMIMQFGATDGTACRQTVIGNRYPGIVKQIVYGVRL